MTEQNNMQPKKVDYEREHAMDLLQSIKQEAKDSAAELGLPESIGYDILAVIHGQAFLGEKKSDVAEVSPTPEEEKMMLLSSRGAQGKRRRHLNPDELPGRPFYAQGEDKDSKKKSHFAGYITGWLPIASRIVSDMKQRLFPPKR